MKSLLKTGLCLICLLFITNLSSQTISFVNPVPSAPSLCNDTWTESSVPQQLVPIPPSLSCSFDYSGGDLWLFPARLVLDLSSIANISRIEIELIDWCGIGCTTAEFFESGSTVGSLANTTTSTSETMIYNNTNGDAIDEMYIQGFENQLFEIRIFSNSTCNDAADPEIAIEDGDIYLEDACNGVILTSPNGTCYRIRVDDNGALITEQLACP